MSIARAAALIEPVSWMASSSRTLPGPTHESSRKYTRRNSFVMTSLSYRIVRRNPIPVLVLLCAAALCVTVGQSRLAAGRAAQEKPPVVAAASDLKFALEEVAKAFTKDTGARVE